MNEVAAAAGVSRQTVSRALNEMAEISEETRLRVLRVCEELSYRPSRFASNLARQKHHAVGLVVASLRNPYYTDLAADLLDETAGRGWQLTVSTSERTTEPELLAELATHVDAIVGYFRADEAAIKHAARGVPVVLIERSASIAGLHSVSLDFDSGVADLVAQLRSRGARRFAMVDRRSAKPDVAYSPSPRRLAVERIVAEPVAVATATETTASAAAAFDDLLTIDPGIDTVIVFNDLMALGVMDRARAVGANVPGDIRIVGIDGLSIGALMRPSLSTLSIDRLAIARAASEIVADCLEGTAPATVSQVVLPRPLWRESA